MNDELAEAKEQAESFKAMYHQACDWRDAKIEVLEAALAVVSSQNDHLTAWVEELSEERDDAKAALAKAVTGHEATAATLHVYMKRTIAAEAALAKAKEHVFSLEATICSQRMRLAQLERRDRAATPETESRDDTRG